MNSVDVVREIVSSLKLEDHSLHLIRHPALVNWRQQHHGAHDRLANIDSGIRFDAHRLHPVTGRAFGQIEIDRLTTREAPLVSLASLVISPSGERLHLAMMNLHLDQPLPVAELAAALRELACGPVYLMRTDRYYHAYAAALLGEAEWKLWNLRFLMIDAIVSPRYIGHSLERGFNLLRLNAADRIKTMVPHLVPEGGAAADPLDALRAHASARHGQQLTRAGDPYSHHLGAVEARARTIACELGLSPGEADLIRRVAILHDCIEDTEADYEEIAAVAGAEAAELVACLSNDKRRSKAERDRAFLAALPAAPLAAHVVKLADLADNLASIMRQREAGEPFNLAYFDKASAVLAVLDPRLRTTTVFRGCALLLTGLREGA